MVGPEQRVTYFLVLYLLQFQISQYWSILGKTYDIQGRITSVPHFPILSKWIYFYRVTLCHTVNFFTRYPEIEYLALHTLNIMLRCNCQVLLFTLSACFESIWSYPFMEHSLMKLAVWSARHELENLCESLLLPLKKRLKQ